ncbi:MAG: restriction endonuclease [Syntrophobacteraceae bacterium]
MAIPDYQAVMLPLLRFFGDGKEHSYAEAVEALSSYFKLTEEERRQMLPSGQQALFFNRVGWARTYLKQACLIEPTRRSVNRITIRGQEVLAAKPQGINVDFLNQFEEFRAFRTRRRSKETELVSPPDNGENEKTPEETLEAAYEKIQEDLASELIQRLKACPPSFFERLVVDVLLGMGYGGTRQDAGKAIGRSGDGGIDGIIKEDRLGLDAIYVQAKRWEGAVGRPEIQRFVGALTGQKARKGVFITTSDFTGDAKEYAARIEMKVVLINGETLAQLMIDHNVGVSTAASYELKRIDSDYFSDG